MKFKSVHCLFEQSGVFKNEFKRLGFTAFDYDISNSFGETDFTLDLFAEISKSYKGLRSIFDNFKPDDLLLAFFPCTRFSEQIILGFKGSLYQQKNHSLSKRLEYDLKLHNELNEFYSLISKLVIICLHRSLRLVIENPYSTQHYLTRYWCLEPSVIISDRRLYGDYFKKPTQFFFINCKPENNVLFDVPISLNPTFNIVSCRKSSDFKTIKEFRSYIHPDFALRFIRCFLMDDINK